VYRFRAMRPPFAGRNPNSRSDLVYRGQVSLVKLELWLEWAGMSWSEVELSTK
jgi:hypothetical protein